jgi:glycine cleavage system H protein
LEEYTHQADKFIFHVRKGLLYSRDEVWVKTESDGSVRVGITDYAQRRGGDIVFAEAQPTSTKVEKGGLLGSYETVKLVQDILSPIDGDITETNSLIDSKPEVINRDPYGEGWVAIIKPSSVINGLSSAEEYFELMKTKVAGELVKIKGM